MAGTMLMRSLTHSPTVSPSTSNPSVPSQSDSNSWKEIMLCSSHVPPVEQSGPYLCDRLYALPVLVLLFIILSSLHAKLRLCKPCCDIQLSLSRV